VSSRYAKKLHDLELKGRFRELVPVEQYGAGIVKYKGRKLLNLSSNDYLGLGQDSELLQRFYQELDRVESGVSGFSAASSRLLTGDSLLSHHLEDEIANAYKSESVLLFNSGYHANIGILPTLFAKGDLILSDKLNHASIHDGLQLSRADHKRFRHGDYEQLYDLLKKHRKNYDQVVIVSESVFSMDGDEADLARLIELKHEFDVKLYLDEAHGVGVYGQNGLGKAEEKAVLQDIDFLVGTFGKALASIGAFVCCSKEIHDYLVNHSRSFIFTTGLPPVTVNWNRFVFQHMLSMNRERLHLQQLSTQLRHAFTEKGIATRGTTNIVPVLIGDDSLALAQAKKLQERGGYLVLPVRPPTVPEGTARFRLSICANMQWKDLQELPLQIAAMASGAKSEK
jgi:8-amino-7-oxononanoate synthase